MQASRSVLPPLPWKTETALKGSGWVGVAPPPGQRGSASARQLSREKSLKIFDWDGTRVIYVFLTAVALIYSIIPVY